MLSLQMREPGAARRFEPYWLLSLPLPRQTNVNNVRYERHERWVKAATELKKCRTRCPGWPHNHSPEEHNAQFVCDHAQVGRTLTFQNEYASATLRLDLQEKHAWTYRNGCGKHLCTLAKKTKQSKITGMGTRIEFPAIRVSVAQPSDDGA